MTAGSLVKKRHERLGQQEDQQGAAAHQGETISQRGADRAPDPVVHPGAGILGHQGQGRHIQPHDRQQHDLLDAGGDPVGGHGFFAEAAHVPGDDEDADRHGQHGEAGGKSLLEQVAKERQPGAVTSQAEVAEQAGLQRAAMQIDTAHEPGW